MEPRVHFMPDAQALEQMRMANLPLLPVHDAALLQIANTSSVVAWRPDGRILAAFSYYDAVNLYDCVTGRKIAFLPLSLRNEPLAGSVAMLRWSPDGTHLLLSSSWGARLHFGDLGNCCSSCYYAFPARLRRAAAALRRRSRRRSRFTACC